MEPGAAMKAEGQSEVARAEALLAMLDRRLDEAERRLQEANAMVERTVAVAAELRDDVSNLIVALEGLAAEVDSQVREHASSLMAAVAAAESVAPSQSAGSSASGDLSAEVAGLIEELRKTADDISADLQERATALRALIDEASRVGATVAAAQTGRSVSATSEPEETALPDLREHVAAVRDEVVLARRAPESEKRDRYAEARSLAAQGVGADEIARRCGLGREEVRMLLRLHRRGLE